MATKKATATKKVTKSAAKKTTKAVAKKNLVPLKDATPKKENLVPIKDRYVPLKENNPKGHGAAKGAVAGSKDMRHGFGANHTFARGNAVRYANGLNKIYK